MTDNAVKALLDRLILHWRWARGETAPAIVRGDSTIDLTASERDVLASLRRKLTEDQWQRLPELLRARRAEREHDRLQREEEEHQRRLSERERQAQKDAARELERRRRKAEELAQRQDEWCQRELERQAAAERRRRTEADELARRQDEQRQHELERQAKQRQRELERQVAAERNRRTAGIRQRVRAALANDFRSADEAFATDPDATLLGVASYDKLKRSFVQDWAGHVFGYQLDAEQATAVGTLGGDVRVIARAGSGKTRTLAARATFLTKHCGLGGRSLLLLAFNRMAAEQMRTRLADVLGNDLPHIMTFHALAHALVHPEEDLVYDDPGKDQLGLSREIQDVIDDHLRDDKFGNTIRDLMLQYFRNDWERILEGGFHLDVDELLAHRRSLPRETLNGEFVKSYGEKVIGNALFEHSVEYRYERNFRWSGVNYRPDFTIPFPDGGGVVIEYFGLEGDPDYDEQSQAKRRFWSTREDWTLLEFTPHHIAGDPDRFVTQLLEALARAGVASERRTEEEIWKLVRRRAIDRFTGATRTFVSRCRKLGLSTDTLAELLAAYVPLTDAEKSFLDLGQSVYTAYLDRLTVRAKEDFDGLMWRAIARIHDGETRFVRDQGREHGDLAQLRYVLVDEFQDFSHMFYELASGIRAASSDVEFFCVGDDWQAINGFAGSELRFFTDFGEYFHDGITREIGTNYRSPSAVVAVGNAVMDGLGTPARASRQDEGLVWECDLEQFRPTTPEQDRHNGDEITPAVLRLVRFHLHNGHDVVMLSRRNGLPWYVNYQDRTCRVPHELERFLEHIRAYLPEDDRPRVTISTTHKYKGLEQPAVIVLDALDRSYPLIHPTWVFLRVFGDSVEKLEAEERRLFYVAVTRAANSLTIITERRRASPYLKDIEARFELVDAPWEALLPAPSLDGPSFEICVLDAYNMKEELKSLGYHFDWDRRCWNKSVPVEGFSFENLIGQAWCEGAVRIEVRTEAGDLVYRR